MSFDSPIRDLETLLKDIDAGKIQLPDFQRPWKWDVDRIRSLLASIAKGFPVGVVMTLETGSDEVNFAVRPLSGARTSNATPHFLLLDGQQRLTSLYQSLLGQEPVDSCDPRGKVMRGYFYIRIDASLDPDLDMEDDAIFFVKEDRVVRANFDRDVVADFSDMEKEIAAGVFPLNKIFDTSYTRKYSRQFHNSHPDSDNMLDDFFDGPLKQLSEYKVPVIELSNTTKREAVCTVFEKVNTGGVALNVFELLTATFAAGSADFRLNDDWTARKKKIVSLRPVLSGLENTDFLQAISLLASRKRRLDYSGESEKVPGITCKRKDILKLSLDDYLEWADRLTDAFIWAGQFINNQFIFRHQDLPYRTQLVPLAAIRVALGTDADLQGVARLITRWYWSGVLGELYGGAVETRFARDLEEVEAWVRGGNEPGTVAGASFNPDRLLTLRTRNSAAYKGIYALTMRGDVKDWIYNRTINQGSYQDFAIDIHHIFPQKWCATAGIDNALVQSIVNKTPISSSTNRFISAKAPSRYVAELAARAQITAEEIHASIAAHQIEVPHLLTDDFHTFFEDRRHRLLNLIASAMGKPVLTSDLYGHDDFELFVEAELIESGAE
ncbi:DUF262 domain-containing protein [Arthrobacter sp. NPDC056727]|uniref:GmrSD restriction endonuclease domain-containing protein n=1 Tax=Arthrobacter sp. NPDC056727 TaxID=3345927 RepID=UPI00367262A0